MFRIVQVKDLLLQVMHRTGTIKNDKIKQGEWIRENVDSHPNLVG